jgi:hypothetical protein
MAVFSQKVTGHGGLHFRQSYVNSIYMEAQLHTDSPARDQIMAMDLATFCRRHSVSLGTAHREIRAGRLRVHRLGRKILVTPGDAEAWLRRLAEAV